MSARSNSSSHLLLVVEHGGPAEYPVAACAAFQGHGAGRVLEALGIDSHLPADGRQVGQR